MLAHGCISSAGAAGAGGVRVTTTRVDPSCCAHSSPRTPFAGRYCRQPARPLNKDMNDARPLITAIANPTSGAGAALHRWESIAARLEAAGRRTRVVRTEGRGHAGEAAEAAARAGDLVVAVGGDGHVLEITTGVVRGGGTMALVPAGRGNDLARALGLPASDQDLADLLLTGEVRHLDVLEVAGQFIPGNVYFGLDGDASRIVNEYRWVPARLLYRINGPLALLRWRPLARHADRRRPRIR